MEKLSQITKKVLASMVVLLVLTGSAFAQITITGKVMDEQQKPIEGVSVRIKGAKTPVSTDAKGEFTLEAKAENSGIIVLIKEGYDTKEVLLDGKTYIEVTMTSAVRTDFYGQIVKRHELMVESRDGILTFESADKKFRTWYDIRVQLDANVYDYDTYNPIGNGITIRRARFAVKTILYKKWYSELDLDFESSGVELKDAYIMYDLGKGAFVRAGHFKEPFSMETTTTSRYVTFLERSLVSRMTPSRHLGIQGAYSGAFWMATGGVFFNTVGDIEETTYTKDNNKKYGMDEGYSLTGRAVVNPILDKDKMLHIGIAGSYRTPKTHLEVPNSYRYSTRSYSAINRKKYLDTDDILDVKDNVLGNVELAGMYKNFMFQGQYITNTVHRSDANLKDVHMAGFYVQAGILIFGSRYAYNKAEGEFTRPQLKNDWGDVEFAIRYDYMNATDATASIFGGEAEGYTAGLTWRANPNIKIMINYSYLNHDRYANGKGKYFIWEDEAGNKYTDITGMDVPAGEAGEKFGMWGFRIEMDF